MHQHFLVPCLLPSFFSFIFTDEEGEEEEEEEDIPPPVVLPVPKNETEITGGEVVDGDRGCGVLTSGGSMYMYKVRVKTTFL